MRDTDSWKRKEGKKKGEGECERKAWKKRNSKKAIFTLGERSSIPLVHAGRCTAKTFSPVPSPKSRARAWSLGESHDGVHDRESVEKEGATDGERERGRGEEEKKKERKRERERGEENRTRNRGSS